MTNSGHTPRQAGTRGAAAQTGPEPGVLAHTDLGGAGTPLLLLPGAGDLAGEHRFLAAALAAAGRRVVIADLPGHGDSPTAASYGVVETGQAIIDLAERLASGPVVVVGCSFAPAAAVWAAVERPDLFAGLVAISPHLDADASLTGRLQRLSIQAGMRGPWAAGLWSKLYRGWYRSAPDDLDEEIAAIRRMLADKDRRTAVRETLVADRAPLAGRLDRVSVPVLVVFGTDDDHFADPSAEAVEVAERLAGSSVMVDGTGHYPHVERPDLVAPAILDFLERTCPEQG